MKVLKALDRLSQAAKKRDNTGPFLAITLAYTNRELLDLCAVLRRGGFTAFARVLNTLRREALRAQKLKHEGRDAN